jgi:replicative DNA helicase
MRHRIARSNIPMSFHAPGSTVDDAQFPHPQRQPIEHLRVPPQSIEAEQAVLGGLMLASGRLRPGRRPLNEDDFYRRDHQLIYRAIRELAEKNQPCDAVTLGEWFESQGLAEQVAGGAYLVELASTTPSAANIAAYADIVRDKAVLRQLIDVGTGIVNDAFQPEGRDSDELLERPNRKVFALPRRRSHAAARVSSRCASAMPKRSTCCRSAPRTAARSPACQPATPSSTR